MNLKALFYAILIVVIFAFFSHLILSLIFKLVPIVLFVSLGAVVYHVIKDKIK